MNILVDTNILLRSLQPSHAHFKPATDSLRRLRRTDQLCVTPQNLYELWVVCTRPANVNGLGMSTTEAQVELANTRSLFAFLPDTPAIYQEWEKLVVQYDVKGKTAHDARLVAAMNVHGVTHLVTFNVSDFSRYAGIQLVDPMR
jgi:predicted nucleic acid-binding protein